MSDADGKPGFWTTIPGILTGIAALLTAATGFYLAIPHNHTTTPSPAPSAAIVEQAPSASAPQAQPHAQTPAGPAAPAGTVTLRSRAGDTSQLFAKTFQHNTTAFAIELISGQTIPFDKIHAIDFLPVDTVQDIIPVTITLVDGRTVSGAIHNHYAYKGETDLGPFSIPVQDVKQIVFDH